MRFFDSGIWLIYRESSLTEDYPGKGSLIDVSLWPVS